MQSTKALSPGTWHEAIANAFKKNDVRLITYVPDTVLIPVVDDFEKDPFFTIFCAAREEEAVGIVAGAWMGGTAGAVLMQASGFATIANTLASLCVPYQIPLIMVISERGTLGEFNPAQTQVRRVLGPTLDSLGIEHQTLRRADEVDFIVDRSIAQAFNTQSPIALSLSPILTGGKVEKKKL